MIRLNLDRLDIDEDNCVELEDDDLLEHIDIEDAIWFYGDDQLIEEMGFDIDLCFGDEDELISAIKDKTILTDHDIKFEPKFQYMEDRDLYDRFVDLLKRDKINCNELNKIFDKYEY